MNLAQFKQTYIKRHSVSNTLNKIVFNLTNLTYNGTTEVDNGAAYQCTIAPVSGKYLPLSISITGTKSAYAFKYDYTTGVITIPSDEIYGNITITAVASAEPTNVSTVLTMAKTNATTYDGTNEYSDENFVAVRVVPSRGSTVKVTCGGVTKEIIGDLPTKQYDSIAKEIYFGTYNGINDGATIEDSNTVTISGAYESYGDGIYYTKNKLSSSKSTIYAQNTTSITNFGCPRYIMVRGFSDNTTINLDTLPSSIEEIKDYAFYNCTSLVMESPIKNLIKIGAYAFCGCTALNPSSLSNNLTTIGKSAFDGCTSIALSSLPNNLTTIEDRAFYGCINLALTSLPSELVSIGTYAFYDCTSTKFSFFPNKLKKIGTVAFYRCSFDGALNINGDSLSIDDYAFDACYSLTDLSLSGDIFSIGKNPWRNCFGITNISVSGTSDFNVSGNCLYQVSNMNLIMGHNEVSIPNGIISIGDYAFYKDTDAQISSIPESVIEIREHAFSECPGLILSYLPSNLISIGIGAFSNCKQVTCNILPDTLTSLGEAALFSTGISINKVPNGITVLNKQVFSCCDEIKFFTFHNNITQIGEKAFENCPSFNTASLPSSLVTIEREAFKDCVSLNISSLPNNITSIGNYAFSNTAVSFTTIPNIDVISYGVFTSCNNITSFVIPDSVTKIDGEAFAYTCLSSISGGQNVTTIGTGVFKSTDFTSFTWNFNTDIPGSTFFGCDKLQSVNTGSAVNIDGLSSVYSLTTLVIGESATTILDSACYNSDIITLTIGSNVTSIGSYAFGNSTSSGKLTTIISLATTPPTCETNSFQGNKSISTIIVPSGCASAYKNASVWSNFANVIVEE